MLWWSLLQKYVNFLLDIIQIPPRSLGSALQKDGQRSRGGILHVNRSHAQYLRRFLIFSSKYVFGMCVKSSLILIVGVSCHKSSQIINSYTSMLHN